MPGKRRCSDKCYEGFVGKDLEYYGEMKNLVLLGKLQLLDRLLPEDMSGCEVIEEDGKITVREKNHTLTWDYSWITRAINT